MVYVKDYSVLLYRACFILLLIVSFLSSRTHLEREHLLVDGVEGGHGFGPRAEAGHVAAHPLGRLDVVVGHVEVWTQQLHHLLIDGVFGELL